MAEANNNKTVVVNNDSLQLRERAFLATKRFLNNCQGADEFGRWDKRMKTRVMGINDYERIWDAELLVLAKVAIKMNDKDALQYIQGQSDGVDAKAELAALTID